MVRAIDSGRGIPSRGVHDCVSRAVAAVVVDYKVLELLDVVVDGHPPLLVVVALRHIGHVSPVAVAHCGHPIDIDSLILYLLKTSSVALRTAISPNWCSPQFESGPTSQ